MDKTQRIALLIDCDNVSHNSIEGVLDEIAKHGKVTVRHAHGDWKSEHLSGWVEKLHPNAIRPLQQFAYTTGKNATDSAMIIDAMDILLSQKVDGFCLVSSDSDFTRLATRIRESGLMVIGIGEKKTPQPFIVACDKFIYLEIIADQESEKKIAESKITSKSSTKTTIDRVDNKLIRLLKSSVEDIADDDGWAALSAVGALLNKKKPDKCQKKRLNPL